VLARGDEGVDGDGLEFGEVTLQGRAQQAHAGFAVGLRAVRRLANDAVNAAMAATSGAEMRNGLGRKLLVVASRHMMAAQDSG